MDARDSREFPGSFGDSIELDASPEVEDPHEKNQEDRHDDGELEERLALLSAPTFPGAHHLMTTGWVTVLERLPSTVTTRVTLYVSSLVPFGYV